MHQKRELALRLMSQGVAPAAVRQQLGVSKTWIYKVRQDAKREVTGWDGVERRINAARRQGRDRRTDPNRPGAGNDSGDRRKLHDRRSQST
jgi:hypothetical protein